MYRVSRKVNTDISLESLAKIQNVLNVSIQILDFIDICHGHIYPPQHAQTVLYHALSCLSVYTWEDDGEKAHIEIRYF